MKWNSAIGFVLFLSLIMPVSMLGSINVENIVELSQSVIINPYGMQFNESDSIIIQDGSIIELETQSQDIKQNLCLALLMLIIAMVVINMIMGRRKVAPLQYKEEEPDAFRSPQAAISC